MLLFSCILALIWGCVWAAFLQWSRLGRFLALRRTWITVVIGVGVDLIIMLLVVPVAIWLQVVVVIALSSVGIVARSIYNELTDEQEIRHLHDQL